MLELDVSNKMPLIMGGDAFYLLYCGEEPLDEASREEATAIEGYLNEKFPLGFSIEEYNVLTGEDEGDIEAIVIPYKESDFKTEYYEDITNYCQCQIYYTSSSHIVWRFFDSRRGILSQGEADIKVNKYNRQYFEPSKGTILFLKTFKKAM